MLMRTIHNADNTEAHYKSTGPELWEQTGGEIDAFVAGLEQVAPSPEQVGI